MIARRDVGSVKRRQPWGEEWDWLACDPVCLAQRLRRTIAVRDAEYNCGCGTSVDSPACLDHHRAGGSAHPESMSTSAPTGLAKSVRHWGRCPTATRQKEEARERQRRIERRLLPWLPLLMVAEEDPWPRCRAFCLA